MRRPVLLDELEIALGVEVLHDDDGRAERLRRHENRSGAAWYIGAGDRYTFVSSMPNKARSMPTTSPA